MKGQLGEAYNVGNNQAEMSVLNLAKTLVELYPEKKLKVNLMEEVIGETAISKARFSEIAPILIKLLKSLSAGLLLIPLGWIQENH